MVSNKQRNVGKAFILLCSFLLIGSIFVLADANISGLFTAVSGLFTSNLTVTGNTNIIGNLTTNNITSVVSYSQNYIGGNITGNQLVVTNISSTTSYSNNYSGTSFVGSSATITNITSTNSYSTLYTGGFNSTSDLNVYGIATFFQINNSGNFTMLGNATLKGTLNLNNPQANTTALLITQNQNTSSSTSVGGAMRLVNTGNNGAGFIVYSNAGPDAQGRLVNIRADNALFPQDALHIDNDGTANAISIIQTDSNSSNSAGIAVTYAGISHAVSIISTGRKANSAALNVVSSNINNSAIWFSGNETNRGTLKIAHTYPGMYDGNAAGISIDLQGTGTAAQGIFMDATNNGTTGNLIYIKNNGTDRYIFDSNGTATLSNALKLTPHATPPVNAAEGMIYVDSDTHTLCFYNSTAWASVSGPGPCV